MKHLLIPLGILSCLPLTLSADLTDSSFPEVRAGRANASWMTASHTFTPDTPLHTALQVTMDPEWHTYWINPGEGGMRFSVDLKLPSGWQASDLQFPAPIAFETAGLKGFGYDGTVWLPITLTPPADAADEAILQITVDWLACDDSSCIPGKAKLSLELTRGEPSPSVASEAIEQAIQALPADDHPFKLSAHLIDETWQLEISHKDEDSPTGSIDPANSEVFPESAGVIDEGGEAIRFTKNGKRWTATAPKSPYDQGAAELTLVLVDRAKQRSIRLISQN